MPYDPEIVSTFDYGTTSPLKLFEYMAAQRPIVATNLNTINKVVRNGADAILVDIGDIDGFCQAIENLIHNVSLGRKMSENAFIKVRKYTWNQRCKKILEHVGYS
jgi:glycosyltransferase involved in cell wall biosynthesis